MTSTNGVAPARDPFGLICRSAPRAPAWRASSSSSGCNGHADDERRDDARLVVSELVGNAVRHARPLADGTMHVAWAGDDRALDIAVTDGGALTTPEKVDAGVSDLAGRGLAIVESLASRWWVESHPLAHHRARASST